MTLIGIDIGGTKCAVIEATTDGTIQKVHRFPTTGVNGTIDRILATITSLNPGKAPMIGISCGGPLDSRSGTILSPPNLPGWDNIPIVNIIKERFGGNVYLMNDANAGALAEWQFGAARGYRNIIFLTHGTGMGAGIILDGRLYEGTTGDAGEVGHIRLAHAGPVGYGKAGSFEGFCSGGGIAQLATLQGFHPSGAGAETKTTARDVATAAEKSDKLALRILAQSGKYLGRALSVLIDILNPEIIVLGSIYARAGKFLQPTMMQALRKETLPRPLAACRIVPAGLGEEIGNYAAIAVALYRDNIEND